MNKNYETEVRARWGSTSAYREHEKKTKNYTKEKWTEANDGLMAVFAEFAECKNSGSSADSDEAQALVAKLQAHITGNYYTCTDGHSAPCGTIKEVRLAFAVAGSVVPIYGNSKMTYRNAGGSFGKFRVAR